MHRTRSATQQLYKLGGNHYFLSSTTTRAPKPHPSGSRLPSQNLHTSFNSSSNFHRRHPSFSFYHFLLRTFVGNLVMFSENVFGKVTRSFRHRHLFRVVVRFKVKFRFDKCKSGRLDSINQGSRKPREPRNGFARHANGSPRRCPTGACCHQNP